MNDDKESSDSKASTLDPKKPSVMPEASAAPATKKAASAKKAAAKKVTTKKVGAAKEAPAAKKAAAAKKGKVTKAVETAKSKRTFPHRTLEDCYKLAYALREHNGGNSWSPQLLAESLGHGGNSSGYYYLTAASRAYGLTTGTRDSAKIELSTLGRELVYPKSSGDEFKVLMTAFRNIELFAKVYDYYNGGNLPEVQYLKNTLKIEWGVDEVFQDDFYDLFQRNLAYLKSKGDLSSTNSGAASSATKAGGSSILLGESAKAGNLVAFIAMPFSEKTTGYKQGYFDEVLKHLITPAAVRANFNSRTAKKAGSEVIQSTIVNDLFNADLVIVDLTEHNPNVLFELGMRIAFSKPVCLIRAKGTAPIFDIDHMLRVYDYNPSMWPSTLEVDIPGLSEHIAKTWEGRDDRSYLTMLRDNKPD